MTAMGLGQRIAVMNYGKIQQIGTPYEIYHEPANIFVAQFMGSPPMNLIPKDDMLLGFHAEDVTLHYGDAPTGHYSLPVEIQQVEYLGADALVYGIQTFSHTDVILKLPERQAQQLATGQSRTFCIPDARLQRFDPGTGLRTKG